MQPKKVLFIHHGGGIGGAPMSMLQLAAALDRNHYDPLVVFTQPGPILEFAHKLGVPAKVAALRSAFFYSAHVPIRLRMLVSFLLHFWPTVRATQVLIRHERPDLVHLNTSVLIPVAIAVKRAGIPLIWHVREVPGSNPILRRWQTGIIARLADHIITNSQYVSNAFPRNAHVTVVHNALDLERFRIDEDGARAHVRAEFGLSSSTPVVGMIGSVQAVKGNYLLVEAAKEITRAIPDVRFLIVAGGVDAEYAHTWKGRVKRALRKPMDNLDHMRSLIERADLKKYFIFTGFRSDIPELLAAMDIVAFLPQAAEGFGRPLIEAMAMGRPVVATDVGPSREILGEGAGILIPPRNAEALTDALIHILTDNTVQERARCKGPKRVEAKFILSQHTRAIEEVYGQVLSLERDEAMWATQERQRIRPLSK